MSRKKIIILAITSFVLTLSIGGVIGYYIHSETINPRATVPTVFNRILSFFVRQGESVDNDLLYHDTNITDFIINGSKKTKVAVEGTVQQIEKEPDGDYHVIVSNLVGIPLVTEFIPEINLPLPKVGDHVRIWGITRFDIPHNWWELHPVIGWKIQ